MDVGPVDRFRRFRPTGGLLSPLAAWGGDVLVIFILSSRINVRAVIREVEKLGGYPTSVPGKGNSQ